LFPREPATVTGERSVCANDPMTGDHDRDRIGPVREAHGARSGRATDAARKRGVVGRLSERDAPEHTLDLTLKSRPMGRRRQRVYSGEIALEIGFER
jgi:hypothetical protein